MNTSCQEDQLIFVARCSGPLVLQKGFIERHNPFGLSPSLSFDQDWSAFFKNLC